MTTFSLKYVVEFEKNSPDIYAESPTITYIFNHLRQFNDSEFTKIYEKYKSLCEWAREVDSINNFTKRALKLYNDILMQTNCGALGGIMEDDNIKELRGIYMMYTFDEQITYYRAIAKILQKKQHGLHIDEGLRIFYLREDQILMSLWWRDHGYWECDEVHFLLEIDEYYQNEIVPRLNIKEILSQAPATPSIPPELDTSQAHAFFKKAIALELMDKDYNWLKGYQMLACFAREMSLALGLGKGDRISWRPFETLFKVPQGKLRLNYNDIQKTGEDPKESHLIDEIFN